MKRLFFDASVIYSAIRSDIGASRRLTLFCKKKRIVGWVTENILEEVERNIAVPAGFIEKNNILVREIVIEGEIKPYKDIIDKKDAHVLAGAIRTSSDYLVTLDKKHINNPKQS